MASKEKRSLANYQYWYCKENEMFQKMKALREENSSLLPTGAEFLVFSQGCIKALPATRIF